MHHYVYWLLPCLSRLTDPLCILIEQVEKHHTKLFDLNSQKVIKRS
jgi:hypothetical protein